jgi:phosphatidylserine/phosphatidylglycerophosphate/cardiolipin synthase-like enzyme
VAFEVKMTWNIFSVKNSASCHLIIPVPSIVLSGSYNFSAAAYSRNTENLLVLPDPNLAQQYAQNWQERWEVSKER